MLGNFVTDYIIYSYRLHLKMTLPTWYKWVILNLACLSTLCTFGYITGSTSIATVYNIKNYNERIISPLISTAQTGFMLMSCK